MTRNKFFISGYIPPPTLSKSSRLGLSVQEDEEYEETVDLDIDNNYDTESADQITESDQEPNPSSTSEASLITEESTTKSEQASSTEVNQPTTTPSTTQALSSESTTRSTTATLSSPTQRVTNQAPVTHEEDEWKPIVMQSNVRAPVTEFRPSVITDDINLANHNLEGLHLDSKTKSDRIIELNTKESPETVEDTPQRKFLQWFNTQLNNAKLKTNNTTPSPSTSSTRFFTLRPVSYSGVQPVSRPKPWVGSPDTTRDHTPVPIDANLRPFIIQTSLTLQKPPIVVDTGSGFLVESPRSQKSLSFNEPQHDGELLKDFFPPVRRPVSRPQITRSGQYEGLPIETLFSKSTSSKIVRFHNNKTHQGNSPIYTFRLSQGQNVHDVLSQLLADLTTGEGPAVIDIDNGPIVNHNNQTLGVEDNNKKASHKKIEDDRLRPWGQLPFRPPVLLNALNLRNNSGSVEATVPVTQHEGTTNSPIAAEVPRNSTESPGNNCCAQNI